MDFDKLKRANDLDEQIRKLDYFIFYANRAWTGKLTIKDKIVKFITDSYGATQSKEFNMNTEIKDRVLKVLQDYKNELEEEFKGI